MPRRVQLHALLFPEECAGQDQRAKNYDDSGPLRASGPHGFPSSSSSRSPPASTCPKFSDSVASCRDSKKGFFWEVFSGEGNLSNMFRERGLMVLTLLDVLHGLKYDLTRRATQRAILRILKNEKVKYLSLRTPCRVFSVAKHGRTNSTRARERERIGCELAFFTAELCRTATSLGIKWRIHRHQGSGNFLPSGS